MAHGFGFRAGRLNVNQTSQDQLNTSTGAPLNEDRFLIRRARLGAFVDQTLPRRRSRNRRQHR